MDSDSFIDLNVKPIISSTKVQFDLWQKLSLSWLGRVAALKMKILPRFNFVFQSLILAIPQGVLNRIQWEFNIFVCGGKKSRIKMGLLQWKREERSIAVSNIFLYHWAALLEHLVQ